MTRHRVSCESHLLQARAQRVLRQQLQGSHELLHRDDPVTNRGPTEIGDADRSQSSGRKIAKRSPSGRSKLNTTNSGWVDFGTCSLLDRRA